jgi:hypothetical protein
MNINGAAVWILLANDNLVGSFKMLQKCIKKTGITKMETAYPRPLADIGLLIYKKQTSKMYAKF